ncbi:UNVERIFIED_CONTAM: hypothetical protein K2H54_045142 [Gekko kuhli]
MLFVFFFLGDKVYLLEVIRRILSGPTWSLSNFTIEMASSDSFDGEDLGNILLSEATMEQFLKVLRDGIQRGIEQACMNVMGIVPNMQWTMENEEGDVESVQNEENVKENQSQYSGETFMDTQLVLLKETEVI